MTSSALILSGSFPRIVADQAAVELQQSALAEASLVKKVESAGEQETAVEALKRLKEFLDYVEESRVSVKRPVLDLGATIDSVAKGLRSEVKAEWDRIGLMVGEYQTEQRLIASRLEAQRQIELKKVEDSLIEPLNSAQVQHNVEIMEQAREQLGPAPAPPKAEGQTIREQWDFELTNIWDLVKVRPDLVDPRPKRREILEVINGQGVREIKGLRIFQTVKIGVRK